MREFRLWIKDPTARHKVFFLLAIILLLLVPLLGWNPLLLLWGMELIVLFWNSRERSLRIFYALMALVPLGLFLANLVMPLLR